MKKIILVVLMVLLVSTPCFAQEVEPEGIISVEGTNWQTILVWTILPIPHFVPAGTSIGFSGGVVYPPFPPFCCIGNVTNSVYYDMMVASFFMYNAISTTPGSLSDSEVGFGILQPALGLGFMTAVQPLIPIPIVIMALLIKTDDNWTPPSE